MISADLRRYLYATRPRCEILDPCGPIVEMAKHISTKAYPNFALAFHFVPVRSRSRRCEYFLDDNLTYVILDIELSDRLMELDLLAQLPNIKTAWVYTFFLVLLSDVFRRQRDLRRYRYCVVKALGDRASLDALSSLPKGGSTINAAIAPILLHELAHVAFQRGVGPIDPIRSMVRSTLDRFSKLAGEHARTGQSPMKKGAIVGVPFEEYDEKLLSDQLQKYSSTINGNSELEEELTCDFMAALALITSETGINYFENLSPASVPISARQLGDILFLAFKTSRYLQFMAGLQQFGINVSSEERAARLDRKLIEMTSRTNGLTHLLLNFYKLHLETTEFETNSNVEQAANREQMNAAMGASIARTVQLHHDRLYQHFDTLMSFFLEAEAFDQEYNDLFASYKGKFPETMESIDTLRNTLPI